MDLASRVIEANEKEANEREMPPADGPPNFFNVDLPEVDEYGLPTVDSIDYFIARMLYIDRGAKDGHLHMRNDGRVWKGNKWVSENLDNLYRLAEWRYPIKTWQKEAIWKKLREVLPALSRDKYIITDELVWNREEARLERVDNKPNAVQ